MIYLQTPVDTLLDRVNNARSVMNNPSPANYLDRLAVSYSEFFHQYEAAPLLIVNNEHLDLRRAMKHSTC